MTAVLLAVSVVTSGCTSTGVDQPTGSTYNQGAPAETNLVLSFDEGVTGESPCASAFCDFFSVTLANNGDAPVNLYDSICLVAGGKTYAENFGYSVNQTINPGASYMFDAAFRPADGAHVTEMYLGDCSSGMKDVSLALDYMASDF
jgi:hypothetical protein